MKSFSIKILIMNINKRTINGPKTIAAAISEHVLFYPSPINLNYI
jgi:hypothetical protein